MKNMTFSEYIISERSENFYYISLSDISKLRNITLEEWFSDMYYDWNLLYNQKTNEKNKV